MSSTTRRSRRFAPIWARNCGLFPLERLAHAITSLAVLDEATGEVLEVFLGTAINMEGFGDDTLLVYAISHDVVLGDDWTSLDSITSVSGDGCISVAETPVLLIGETCEIPSCDGGTMLTRGETQTQRLV